VYSGRHSKNFGPWFRGLVAGILTKKPRFSPMLVHVGILVEKFRWYGFSNENFDFPCQAISVGGPCPPALRILSC